MSQPAGLRRRGLALLIDMLICSLILACLAPLLFAATGGRWQYIPDFQATACRPLDEVPAGVSVPSTISPNYATVCEHTFAGWPAARVLTVGQVTVDGNLTTDLSYSWPLDAEDTVLPGAVQESWSTALLVLFRFLFDAIGRTPGRRLCGIAVVDRATGERASFSRLWRRYLVFALPVAVEVLGWVVTYLTITPENWPAPAFATLFAALAVFAGLTLWAVASIWRRKPTYYDRFVGTSVVRC